MKHWCNDTNKERVKYPTTNTLQCQFVTTNPTWIEQEQNPDLRGRRPATNLLTHLQSGDVCVTMPVRR